MANCFGISFTPFGDSIEEILERLHGVLSLSYLLKASAPVLVIELKDFFKAGLTET